jgi:hypothetical protein
MDGLRLVMDCFRLVMDGLRLVMDGLRDCRWIEIGDGLIERL